MSHNNIYGSDTRMRLLGRLNMTALITSFAVGILYTYMVTPSPTVIVKFPSPYNAGKVTYRDQSDTCYKYKSDHVDCAAHEHVMPQPLMLEGFTEV